MNASIVVSKLTLLLSLFALVAKQPEMARGVLLNDLFDIFEGSLFGMCITARVCRVNTVTAKPILAYD